MLAATPRVNREAVREWSEVQALLPPLSRADRRLLAESIAAEGVRVPVLVLPDGRIVDGHHRWELSGGGAPYEVLDIPEDRAFALAIALNLARRHLSPDQLADVHERLRRDKALRRETALRLREQGATQAEAAAAVGVARQTVGDWEQQAEQSDGAKSDESDATSGIAFAAPDVRVVVPRSQHPVIYARREAGESEIAIAADYRVTPQRIGQIVRLVETLRRRPEPRGETPGFPAGPYRCLVIDPPWDVGFVLRVDRPWQGDLPYPTMTLEEIAALPVPELAAQEGCHVYLWFVHRYLHEALHLFESWGVRYQCLLTWKKPVGITPYSWRYNSEHVLFGRVGTLPLERLGLPLCFEAAVTRHSAKPDEFYEQVRAASPGPRLDLFARTRREGFDAWGNEVPALDEAAG